MARKTKNTSHNVRKKTSKNAKSGSKISRSLMVRGPKVKETKSGTIIQGNFRSKKTPEDDLCSNCGIRQKGPGFRFLCRYCFRKADDNSVYSINASTISKDIFFTKIPM
jgi:hypothetical protein